MSEASSGLVGAWTLIDYTTTDLAGGRVRHPLGAGARGVLVYTADGYMSVQIAADDRSHYATDELHGGTGAERASAAAGYLAYAGRFEVSPEGIVTHLIDISLFPNWSKRQIRRRATLRGDLLTLGIVEPITVDGVSRTGILTWQRFAPSPVSASV
ncbi:lipocalin-like domain-containing protein [Nocardioides humi]|uniref:Lipocalin-like domain-containing protein n=1 Tax=Nocardioides humi TaxID=449461 RepID=A0ABN2C063_9ACTN|nr:lipocalin-like domain-containing protein [Nocardioides humi]